MGDLVVIGCLQIHTCVPFVTGRCNDFNGMLSNMHASHLKRSNLAPYANEKAGNFVAGQAALHVLTDLQHLCNRWTLSNIEAEALSQKML